MINLTETQSDLDIKNDLYRFIDGEYDSYFTPEKIQYGIEYSFLLNFSYIEDTRLVFNYEDFRVIVPFDDILGLTSEQIKLTILFWLTKDEIFKGALKSFLRDHRLSKLLG
jgi:hypothetical protein